jgi:hypothetical protein
MWTHILPRQRRINSSAGLLAFGPIEIRTAAAFMKVKVAVLFWGDDTLEMMVPAM